MELSRSTLSVFLLVTLVLGGAIGASATGVFESSQNPTAPTAEDEDTSDQNAPGQNAPDQDDPDEPDTDETEYALDTFDSRAEFESYLRATSASVYYGGGGGGGGGGDGGGSDGGSAQIERTVSTTEVSGEPASAAPDRVSGTNVQEQGIDEADILKTDGTTFYFSGGRRHLVEPVARGEKPTPVPYTRIVDASTPEDPRLVNNLSASGNFLLTNDSLVAISGDSLRGFDVSTPAAPTEEWSKNLTGRVIAARLLDGRGYLVVQTPVLYDDPCPIEPVSGLTVRCSNISRPSLPTPVETTTTVISFDPRTGELYDTATAVTSWSSATYMSENALYITHSLSEPRGEFYLQFLLTAQRDRLDADTVERLERLDGYELSDGAIATETRAILADWYRSLDDEERQREMKRLSEDYTEYVNDHKRELERTGIVRLDVNAETGNLTISATGVVPGHPLNQFSLDEHEGHLRIATTVNGWQGESENDVYVLDESLDVTGSVQGMGLDERIYSVRFVGDEGYVVTFRRIDPFHVLNLSDPENPSLEGELKLPGFSSYLHPLGENRILGVGEEDGATKLVVFDVSDPSNPTVESDLILDDRWSEIRTTHHAFLQDSKHEVVFVPGQTGGHVISYAEGDLSKSTTIDTRGPARRAAYVDDYLYVFSDESVTVVDERTWETETSLRFTR